MANQDVPSTLLNFLTTYVCFIPFVLDGVSIRRKVIHAQVLKFHDDFRDTKSLDEMIQVHDEQCVVTQTFRYAW